MTWEVIAGLRRAVARAKVDPAVRVVVLAGAGDQAFCAGADLSGMVPGDPGGTADEYADHHLARGWLAELFEELWQLGKPTIARVQGWAMAGGFGLALACDMVIASEQARFGAPELNVGPVALHGHRAHAAVDAPQEGPRADADQPGGGRGGGRPDRLRHPGGARRPARRRGGRAGRGAGLQAPRGDEDGPRFVLRCARLSGHRGPALSPRHADRHQPDGRGGGGDRRLRREAATVVADGHRRHRHPTVPRPEELPAWRNEH